MSKVKPEDNACRSVRFLNDVCAADQTVSPRPTQRLADRPHPKLGNDAWRLLGSVVPGTNYIVLSLRPDSPFFQPNTDLTKHQASKDRFPSRGKQSFDFNIELKNPRYDRLYHLLDCSDTRPDQSTKSPPCSLTSST